MNKTPLANRPHILILGRRNVGKSSLLNALTKQKVALVSSQAGTTTDPVYKTMELYPIGPIVIIDTAGLDDCGDLGSLRVALSKELIPKADLALLLVSSENDNWEPELSWIEELRTAGVDFFIVENKMDLNLKSSSVPSILKSIPWVKVSALQKTGLNELKDAIVENIPVEFEAPRLVGDLLTKESLVLLVLTQDIQAPKGRLILPQVQVIRDILNHQAQILISQPENLKKSLANLKKAPDLIICDSQVFQSINKIIPSQIPLSSFSIIMARYKGDLKTLVAGAKTIDKLKPGDKILMAEGCSHHALENDIGKMQIPKALQRKVGGDLHFTFVSGKDFPIKISDFNLIINCGSCMQTRKSMLWRIKQAEKFKVPITNYGLVLGHLNGILERLIEPFKKGIIL